MYPFNKSTGMIIILLYHHQLFLMFTLPTGQQAQPSLHYPSTILQPFISQPLTLSLTLIWSHLFYIPFIVWCHNSFSFKISNFELDSNVISLVTLASRPVFVQFQKNVNHYFNKYNKPMFLIKSFLSEKRKCLLFGSAMLVTVTNKTYVLSTVLFNS